MGCHVKEMKRRKRERGERGYNGGRASWATEACVETVVLLYSGGVGQEAEIVCNENLYINKVGFCETGE